MSNLYSEPKTYTLTTNQFKVFEKNCQAHGYEEKEWFGCESDSSHFIVDVWSHRCELVLKEIRG